MIDHLEILPTAVNGCCDIIVVASRGEELRYLNLALNAYFMLMEVDCQENRQRYNYWAEQYNRIRDEQILQLK